MQNHLLCFKSDGIAPSESRYIQPSRAKNHWQCRLGATREACWCLPPAIPPLMNLICLQTNLKEIFAGETLMFAVLEGAYLYRQG